MPKAWGRPRLLRLPQNDPSKSEMYANTSGQVSAFVSGFPISSDRYIHQHVDLNGHTWVVTN